MRLASFLLLPVYTSHLSPADYGCIAILDLTAAVLGAMLGRGIVAAVNRYHFEAQDEAGRDRVWWTGMTCLVLLATAVVVPALVSRQALARLTLGATYQQGGFYYALVFCLLWFNTIGGLSSSYLRVRKWSGLYVGLELAALIVNIGLNLYFLIVLQLGVAGILLGNLLAGSVKVMTLTAIFVSSRGPYALHWPLVGQLWRFGSPLVVTAFLALLMHQADRYL